MHTTLLRLITVASIAMQFGQVRRVTLHEDGEAESDTTHTVMLALFVMEVAPLVGIDVGLAVRFALVHDLPETYAGDTNTAHGLTAEERAAKDAREAWALKHLGYCLGDSDIMDLLRRYEAQEEPEARLVRYLDKVTPKLTHFLNHGEALRRMGITAAGVRDKHAKQGRELAERYPEMGEVAKIFEAACALVEDHVDGWPLDP